jgi:hypothetical protein
LLHDSGPAQLLEVNPKVAALEKQRKSVTAPGISTGYGDAKKLVTDDCINPGYSEVDMASIETEGWATIDAYEQLLFKKHGRHVRANRTRGKIKRDGMIEAIEHAVKSKGTPMGFQTLKQMGRADLSFEALVLRHPDRFSRKALESSRRRLNV